MIKWLKEIKMSFSVLIKVIDREKKMLSLKEAENKKKYLAFNNVKLHQVEIGNYSYIADNSIIHNCKIGKYTSIGPNVIIGFGEHPTKYLSTSPIFYSKEVGYKNNFYSSNNFSGKELVKIGNDVWIGASVYIKNGIEIGDGAIIGAGATVIKDVPPYAIVVGIPAKIIKYRFDDIDVKKLLIIKWWTWDEQKVNDNKFFFTSNDLTEFFKKHYYNTTD